MASLLAAAVVQAQESVRFTVYAGGREAGWEECSLRRIDGQLLLKSRASLHRAKRRQELSLSVTLDGDPAGVIAFDARGSQGDLVRHTTLERKGGRLVGEVSGEGARKALDLDVGPGAIVLAEPFAAPWLPALARYDWDAGGKQEFPAVFPLLGKSGNLTLTLREEEALEIDGRAVLARRILAEPEFGEVANLWLGPDRELLVCALSVAGISAVRGASVRIGLKPGEDPPDPEGVDSSRLRFASERSPLAGTFSRPASGTGRLPAVLLLSGSGPHDRNGNPPRTELQWNFLHSIAMDLAARGIASLRYDDRGVAASSGSFADAGFADLASDAASALHYLASRDDVDVGRLGVIGHSEGALIAAKLAEVEAGTSIASLVLIGAPAEPLDRMLLSQVRRRLGERGKDARDADRILARMRAFFEHVRLSRGDVLVWRGRSRRVRWLREHLEVDPLKLFGKVSCPTLVVQGEKDLQVPAGHRVHVASALASEEVETVLIPGAGHFLMPATGKLSDYAEARRRVRSEALDAIGGWLSRRFATMSK